MPIELCLLLPHLLTVFWLNVSFDNVRGRYYPNHTGLALVYLFNRSVLEQGTSYASPGKSLTLASNVVLKVLSLVN
ncbi:MAG: hypothetical protein RM338_24705 [Nostoc sp. DedQUE12a]|nr:hypothetical protein [Nostoc sp. DedQUE12a]